MKKNGSKLLFTFVLLLSIFLSLTNKKNVFATTQSNSASGTYSFVVTSDPQYPWTNNTDNGISESEDTKKRRSLDLIRNQYNSINDYANSTRNTRMTIINGDITAFGHSDEWQTMKQEMRRLNTRVTFGLGNHDIENNYGETWMNRAWERSYQNMYDAIGSVPNLLARHAWREDYFLTTKFAGSLSYAFRLGNFRVIQAQNYPTMDLHTSGSLKYSLTNGVNWIQNQLEQAYRAQEPVILNIHKPDSWTKNTSGSFRRMMEKYYDNGTLKAVFAGHFHKNLGKHTSAKNFGKVPVYYSGSASQKSYLINEVRNNALFIYSVHNNVWEHKTLVDIIPLGRGSTPTYDGKIVTLQSTIDPSVVVDWSQDVNAPFDIITYRAKWVDNQRWLMEKVTNVQNTYVFKSVQDPLIRLAESTKKTSSNDAYAKAEALVNNNRSHWELILVDAHKNGLIFTLRNRHSQKVLDIPDGQLTSGTQLITHHHKNVDNQKFILNIQ
ncbi:hemagglutinin [Enterococcus durans]|uniref:RICIN domain-containing protein n=1 Tax=Enterococcus durans TaxID=53345 RepID=UPI000F4E0369|nr:RICIN domain-containing protein [Enterococcus durans]QED60173.1 hemagglutinin [Enterococcus durans]QED62709.1 hemagglutinin [Enterococcus durans]ROX84039.1 hemagglutinin [Enterococcus durans]